MFFVRACVSEGIQYRMGVILKAVLAEMERRDMTQLDLSLRAGVSRPNLNRWLRGQGTLTVESVERVMAVLGLVVRRGNDRGRG